MKGKTIKIIPRFFGLRIYLSSTILYYWLVMPFLLILTIKYAPALSEKGKFGTNNQTNTDTFNDTLRDSRSIDYNQLTLANPINKDSLLNNKDSIPELSFMVKQQGLDPKIEDMDEGGDPDDGTQIGKAFNFLFNLILISYFLGFLFNLPFKRYFSKMRKRKKITDKLYAFCKRFLLKSPVINAAILGLAYLIAHVYMLITLLSNDSFNNELEKSLFQHLFYISLTASVLSVLFVYFWEKHRVHIRYIEHIFSMDELRKRIFNLKVGRIRNRMFLSSAMTTLLPLTIVILYLFLSVTYLGDMEYSEYTAEQKNILFGDYLMFRDLFSGTGNEINIPGWLFYINAINSFFMFIGIYSSIFIAFIYFIHGKVDHTGYRPSCKGTAREYAQYR